ncbi:ribbon-helix-helix domain-containing protein [bacterium]|nr:ribbon-helix-helix domain-containing protein [bacterium]
MKSPEYVPVSGTVLKEQNEWLNRESRRRALPKSALLREAIELLIKKYNHEEAGTNEGYLVQGQAKLR